MDEKNLLRLLRDAVESTRGSFAAGLFEDSGIMIAVYSAQPGFDSGTAANAFGEALRSSRFAADEVRLGEVRQLIIETPQATLFIHPLVDCYTLGLGLESSGNLGQARLTLKRLQEALLPLLTSD